MKNNIVKILFLLFTLAVIALNGYSQNWDWSNHITGTADIFSKDIKLDSEGNAIVSVQMNGGVTIIGTDPLVTETANANIPMLMKFDPTGILLWHVKIGTKDHANLNSIVLDNFDNIYIAGGFTSASEDCTFGSTDINTISLTAVGQDTYIAKYNASGELQWAKNVATCTALCRAEGLTLDSENNILINGFFRGGAGTTIDFGGGNTISYIGNTNKGNAFLAKFNNSGDFIWTKHFSGSDNVRGLSVSRATNEGSYALFSINGDFTVENTAPVISLPVGQLRWAIVKLDNNGDFVWLRTVSSSSETTVVTPSLVSNSVGDVFIGGSVSSTATLTNSDGLDEASLISNGSFDVFGARYNKGGDIIWAKNFGATSIDRVFGVTVNANQFSIYGYNTSAVYIEHDTIPAPTPTYGVYNINLDYSGNLLSHTSLSPVASFDRDGAIAIDEKGNSFIAGFFASSSIEIGANTLTNGGGKDAFLAKHTNIHILPTITPIINNASAAGNIALEVFGGGDEPYSYTLSKEGVTIESGTYSVPINLTGLNGGVYKFEVIDNSSRQVTKYYHIFEPTISKVNPLDELNYCQGQTVNVALEVNIPKAKTYQWLKDGVAITGEGTTNYTATEAGVYTIQVTIDGQVGISNEIVIHVEETPVTGTLTKTPDSANVCENEPLSVKLTPGSGGIEDVLQYRVYNGTEWSTWTDYISESVIPTSGITDVEVQTYRANMYCDSATAVTVSWQVTPAPVAGNINGDNLICANNGPVLTLNNYSGTIVRWKYSTDGSLWQTSGNTDPTYYAPPISQTTHYKVEVANGICPSVSTNVFTVDAEENTIGGSITGTTSICEGETSGELTLTGYLGDVIKWQSSINSGGTWVDINHTADTYTSDPLTQTTQFRTVVKNGVCNEEFSGQATITVNPIPEPFISTIDNLAVCSGDLISVEFTSNIQNADAYQWFKDNVLINGANQSTYITTESGNYSVEVTENGCSGLSNALEVVVNPLPVVTAPEDFQACNGESITLTATGDATSYEWDNSVVDGVPFIITQSTTYTVTGTNTTTGCSATDEVVVTVNPIPEPVISTIDNLGICTGDDINVEFTSNISGAENYQWFKNNEVITGANESSYTATTIGIYSLEVTENGCSGLSNELEIIQIDRPEPIISTADPLEWIEGESISVTFTVDIADADAYQWIADGTPIPGANTASFEATAIGEYSVLVTKGSCQGESNVIAVTIETIPHYTVTFKVESKGGNPIVNVKISVAEFDPIVTNEEGVAVLSTPKGDFNFQAVVAEYHTFDGNFTVNDKDVSVNIVMVPLGIAEDGILSVKLYPNPFSNEIKISDSELVTRVVITSISGQKVMDVNLEGINRINTQNLPAGVYLLKLYTQNGESKVFRMVKDQQ